MDKPPQNTHTHSAPPNARNNVQNPCAVFVFTHCTSPNTPVSVSALSVGVQPSERVYDLPSFQPLVERLALFLSGAGLFREVWSFAVVDIQVSVWCAAPAGGSRRLV